MKDDIMKYILLLIMFSFNFIFAQKQVNNHIYKNFEYGLYGGINFASSSNIGGSLLFEWKIYLLTNFMLKASIGYEKTYNPNSYNVKTNGFYKIDNIKRYYTKSYRVLETQYQIIPFLFGVQYQFISYSFSPYAQIEVGYKWIDPLTIKTNPVIQGEYEKFQDLPNEFKSTDVLPVSSYSFGIGIGIRYKISSKLNLDLRYIYQLESNIVNTHNFLIGLII